MGKKVEKTDRCKECGGMKLGPVIVLGYRTDPKRKVCQRGYSMDDVQFFELNCSGTVVDLAFVRGGMRRWNG